MTDPQASFNILRRDHPVFFWGTMVLILLLLGAAGLVAARVPQYRREAAEIDQRMSREERATRDRILQAQTQRAELGVALLQRELRLKALEEKGVHLAINTADSTLALRHGAATLRQIRVHIGGDSVVKAADGQTWRFVSALGERHVKDKEVGGSYTIPDWVYLSRGQPVPPEPARQISEGLGRYVLRLDDGTEIYSRPKTGPLAEGVKPAAFMIDSEGELRAIFEAIGSDTPVYIY
jgi:hypothetical protein